MTPNRFVRRLRAPALEEVVGGRVAVVTGASSGIGEATALRLAAAGATVVLVARNPENLQKVADEITAAGGVAHVMPCDLSDLAAIKQLAADILAKHGPVEVLVNNAGRSIRRPLDESFDRMHDFERTMQVNYFGAVQLTMALLPSMLEQGSGRIINVATWGVRIEATPLFGPYTASKTALAAFGRTLNVEVSGRGVSVTTVNPALVKTPMIAPTADFEGRPSLRAAEIAEQIAEAV
ncbi:MAG: SDR family NAD(P)-dependent oxidoreductase, partial [Thermoleophilaceae bacterium]|nr:SDR family NAD(P)-dependent oxidoreductase [Thermoleophilaceae bacterium]